MVLVGVGRRDAKRPGEDLGWGEKKFYKQKTQITLIKRTDTPGEDDNYIENLKSGKKMKLF